MYCISCISNNNNLDDKCYKNITVMIYFICVQHMNHRMQITEEHLEYNLMTNSVKFMQQMSTPVTR